MSGSIVMRDGTYLCFYHFEAKKLRSEMTLKRKLNCNKYFDIQIVTMKERWVYKLFS